MKDLDKTKVYDLTELNNEELQHVLDFLCTEDKGWLKITFKNFSEGLENVRLTYDGNQWAWVGQESTANAKELFYTLENVQVDCRYLTYEQIKEMADVFKINGFKYFENNEQESLRIDDIDSCYYLQLSYKNEILIDVIEEEKTTITYEKFMELFGDKEKSEEFNNFIDVLNDELMEEYNKLTERARTRINLEFNPQSEHKLYEAYKETDNKLNYELDFNFITQLAERMAQNKHKYEPYNWQKLDNIAELKQALYRHVMEVMKGNYEDDGRMFAHLESISLNAMFINYQLKKTQ